MNSIKFLMLLAALLLAGNLTAQKPVDVRPFEISLAADEQVEYYHDKNKRIDRATGYPVAIYQVNFAVEDASPEKMAMEYLSSNYKVLGLLKSDMSDLKHHATRSTDAGSVVRYRQYFEGYPVNKAEVTISISPNNKVELVLSSYQSRIDLKNTNATISEREALAIATAYINPQTLLNPITNKLMVYNNKKISRLAYEVVIQPRSPGGEWQVLVDAHTGEIFKVKDIIYYYEKHHHTCHQDPPKGQNCESHKSVAAMVDGSGFVFDPDPLSSEMVAYGGNYSDNGDATNVDLDAARVSVVLRDIDLTSGTYTLKGPWAEIVDFDTPNNGLFTQNTSAFNFTRLEDGFEAVSCYFHIDSMMRYINNTLGVSISPTQYSGGVQFDPHGWSGQDQSSYSSGTGQVRFGEGCVDDGEDSDVIHHELGHALHDWVTSGGLSQVDGLSEGCGDYIAQSYNRSLGNWTPSNPAYHWVFNWDGHNECWGGRITNYSALYPSGLTGSIHTNGQIWATSLMGIYDNIGRLKMDKAFYIGLGMTNSSSSQDDAANAVYQAAINLGYTSAELTFIHNGFTATGYSLPPLNSAPSADFSESATTICLDVIDSIQFMDASISSPAATSWAWSFEGGTPATSTIQNPTVVYSTEGDFDVSLIVTNAFGNDTVTKTDHITIIQGSNCPSCLSGLNNTVVPISASGAGNTYTSIINIPSGGVINDVNVTNITGLHTYLGDLTFSLTSPAGTTIQLNEDVCGSDEDFNVGFDDEAATGTLACPYNDGTLYIPFQALSGLDGEDAAGDWTLTILDDANIDGGELQSWSIEVCVDSPSGGCDADLVLGTITETLNQASNSVISTATISAPDSVVLRAGNFVELQPNFEAQINSILLIEIGSCSTPFTDPSLND